MLLKRASSSGLSCSGSASRATAAGVAGATGGGEECREAKEALLTAGDPGGVSRSWK